MKRTLIISLCAGLMALFTLPALAQNQTFTGTVVDENGDPIIGASVVLVGKASKGSAGGVITDLNGKYTIEAPAGSKINVSYIGYVSQTVKAGSRVQLLEDSQSLEEVVVVGYGAQKKAHLTGSVATVPMDEIQDLTSGGLATMLSGLIAGLSVSGGDSRPGDNATIYIRDTNSLDDVGSTAQQPLFVIDGYVYPNDLKVGTSSSNLGASAFNNLDPAEIESISVLKDAAAAVYGARAANGVILVTTKKGKIGTPKISYTGQFGFTDEVQRTKMLSAYEWGRLYNAVVAADPTNTSWNATNDIYQADELEAMKSLNYDLLDKYWDTGITAKHNVNISGATERASYFGSVSYFTQDGNLGNLDYNRWNYRAGVDVKVNKWISANLSVSGTSGEKKSPYVKIGGTTDEKDYRILLTRPRYIPEEVDGHPLAALGVSNTASTQNQYYSYSVLQNNGDFSNNNSSSMSVNGSIDLDMSWIKPLEGLKLRVSYAKSTSNSENNQYGSSFTVYSMTNRTGSGQHLYTPVGDDDYSAYLVESNFNALEVSNGDAQLNRSMTRTENYQLNFTASYARTFGPHSISALFTIEKSEAESEYLYGMVSDPYPFTTYQSNSADASTKTVTFMKSEAGTMSYVGRINYALSDKYLFEFLVRADASTKFAPENYWGTFPSVSAGWIMSEESWFKNALPWVDFFKVRGSFGLTGRDNTSAWQWMRIYSIDKDDGTVFGTGTSNDSSNRITINKTNSAVNEDVHWDKAYKGNIGFDFSLLKNRLSVTIDAYREWNREMLMNISQALQATIGTQSAAVNLGEMDSWGYELSLTWKDKIGKDFRYKIGLNTSYTDNKVLNMDWETEYLYRQITKGSRSDIGTWGLQCLGIFRSFQEIEEYFDKNNITTYLGMTKDEVRPGMLIYKDVRGAQQSDGTYAGPDGVVDDEMDLVCLSNRSNPYGFSLNLNASYKDFSVSAQIGASWGGYSFLNSLSLKTGDGLAITNMPSFWNVDNMYVYEDIYDGSGNLVVAANRGGSLPNLAYTSVNALTSSFWRISGTRVKLSTMTIAYTIPKKWTKVVGIQNARINITGQNLLSFYNPYPDDYIDPMCTYGNYPALRKFTVGVNLTF